MPRVINYDFQSGGFPISKTRPVVCVFAGGEVAVASNHTELSRLLSKVRRIVDPEPMTCLGVWPGRVNTDVFPLDPEHYGVLSTPKGHEDIDSAVRITVHVNPDLSLDRMEYVPAGTDIAIVTRDVNLVEYVRDACLKYMVVKP